MITYQTEHLHDILDEFMPLLARNIGEVDVAECPAANINWDMYLGFDAQGVLHITTARVDGELAGYALFFVLPDPHNAGRLMAEADVYYMAPEHRKGFAAIRLMREAEKELKQRGCRHVVIRVNMEHDCSAVARYLKYRPIETVWCKEFD